MLSLLRLARNVTGLSPPEGSENQVLSLVWTCDAFSRAWAEDSTWGGEGPFKLNQGVFSRGRPGGLRATPSWRRRGTPSEQSPWVDGRGAAVRLPDSQALELCGLSGESTW